VASVDLCAHIRELRSFGGAQGGGRRGASGNQENERIIPSG